MALHRVSDELTLHVPYAFAWGAVQEALLWLSLIVEPADPGVGDFRARTSITPYAWGERIQVHLWAIAADRTGMSVESTSLFAFHDFGRNAKNIARVIDAVHRAMSTPPATP